MDDSDVRKVLPQMIYGPSVDLDADVPTVLVHQQSGHGTGARTDLHDWRVERCLYRRHDFPDGIRVDQKVLAK